jgi:hypothetical protein
VAIKFMRRTAKYTWYDYKTNEDMLSEIKINPIVKIIQNTGNKWTQFSKWTKTTTLNYEISTVWVTRPRTTP